MERFFEELKTIVESHPDYSEGDFAVVENKGFETIYFCDIAVIKTIYAKKANRLEVTAKYFNSFGLGEPDEKANWLGITYDEQTVCQIYNGAKEVFKRCYKDSAEFTFGCCSRFIECSDAKKCTCKKEHGYNNTKRFSSGSMYKDNLDKGLIFYGKNKNYPSPNNSSKR